MPAWSRGHRATTQRRRPSQNIREFSIGRSVCWYAHTPTGAAAVCLTLPGGRCLWTGCSKSGRRLTDQRCQRCRLSNTQSVNTWRQMSKAQRHRKRAVSRAPVRPPESWTIPVNQKKRRKNEWALIIMGSRRCYRVERLVLGRSGPVHPAVPSLGVQRRVGGTDGTRLAATARFSA